MATKKPKVSYEASIGGSGWADDLTVEKIIEHGKPDVKKPDPEPANKYSEDWYDWYDRNHPDNDFSDDLLRACINDSTFCCGIQELGEWSFESASLKDEDHEAIGAAIKKAIKKQKYLVTYIPNTTEWKHIRAILKAAGFIEGVKVKSNHGRYTNSRWEYLGKGTKYEKTFSSHIV